MKYCVNCGKEVDENQMFCANCGAKITNYSNGYYTKREEYNKQQFETTGEKIGYGILAFLIPLVGFILYFVFKSSKPVTSKICLYVSLISFVLNLLSTILMFVFFADVVRELISNMEAMAVMF